MKKQALSILAIIIIALSSCHTGSSSSGSTTVTPDTAFTGSYFEYSYSGHYSHIKAFPLTSTNLYVSISSIPITNPGHYQILVQDPYQLYGSDNCTLAFLYDGTSTGTFQMSPLSAGAITGFMTASLQSYNDTTGTVTITHSGADYIEGSFSGTMYGSGLSLPVSGSFKVIH